MKYLIIIILSVSSICCASVSNVNSNPNRYVYCNYYMDYACFGITQGDSVNMSIPLDYVLYSVLLSSGDIVGIYTGFNPESTNTLTMVENNICYSNVKMCNLFKVNDSTLRIVYQSTGDDPFLDIQISLKSTMPRSSIKDFLNNFRACRPSGSSVICTENALFDVGKIF